MEIYGFDLSRRFQIYEETMEKLKELEKLNKPICIDAKSYGFLLYLDEDGVMMLPNEEKLNSGKLSISQFKLSSHYLFDGKYLSIWKELEEEFLEITEISDIYKSLNYTFYFKC